MWKTFIFYWICLVAVHIMLLALVCARKGVLDPLDLLCECVCMSASFFRYIWPAIPCTSGTYWFFCGAAVSPAALRLSRLQLCEGKEEKKRWKRWWRRRRRGKTDRSREVGGWERSGDRLWEKSRISYLLGLDDCCVFKVSCRYVYLYVFKPVLWEILAWEGWFVFELKWMFLSTGKH